MDLDTPFTEMRESPIVIRYNKWKFLRMSLLSLAFVLLGLWIMNGSMRSNGYYEGLGLATLIFFGVCLLVFLFFLLFVPSLLLTIDDEGVHRFYPLLRRSFTLRWEEISSIYPLPVRSSAFLTITVSPAAKSTYIARNYEAGKIPSALLKDDGPPAAISLPLLMASLSFTQVVSLIQKRYAAQIEHYQISVHESL